MQNIRDAGERRNGEIHTIPSVRLLYMCQTVTRPKVPLCIKKVSIPSAN